MEQKRVYLGADHAGYELKEHLKKFLQEQGYDVIDKGAFEYEKTDDYPDFAKAVAQEVQKGGKGILVCGSAEGICVAANKFKGIRAVPVHNLELAKLSRQHNNANILCLAGGGLQQPVKGVGLTTNEAEAIVVAWLATPFSGEERHQRRIDKIKSFEQ